MLDPLTFLLEKVLLFARLSAFHSISSGDDARTASRCEGSKLRRGDLLEVPRTLFIHFGIYLGDNKVAHLMPDIMPLITNDKSQIQKTVTNKRLLLGVLAKNATIRVDTVEDFAYGSPVLLNAMDDALKTPPLPNEEVARRAEKLVGAIAYSLLWSNCEHFATYCRYGAASSFQTEKFCESLKSVIRDQRSIFLSALVGVMSIIYLGIAPSTTLPTILVPFLLWMAG
ncbi:lecithin retinol acyltransferase [Paramormyrops kingsleyae]|uniref:Lecithin retinol acyltransferase n=1 Tax=Paramormyrops kingsleyae TaxID=1676925 RepID=A0A3B3T296_9TELE|nr:lecithin retinol acyltransferase-like [Paramormyrops kingsleyae]